mmetsp:Transcript_10852/g.34577  ORF Transcript_10852/g.34577 Transcript_10852/m.34577 type:complete len:266 (-) Transcript_10852:53-850(-)
MACTRPSLHEPCVGSVVTRGAGRSSGAGAMGPQRVGRALVRCASGWHTSMGRACGEGRAGSVEVDGHGSASQRAGSAAPLCAIRLCHGAWGVPRGGGCPSCHAEGVAPRGPCWRPRSALSCSCGVCHPASTEQRRPRRTSATASPCHHVDPNPHLEPSRQPGGPRDRPRLPGRGTSGGVRLELHWRPGGRMGVEARGELRREPARTLPPLVPARGPAPSRSCSAPRASRGGGCTAGGGCFGSTCCWTGSRRGDRGDQPAARDAGA